KFSDRNIAGPGPDDARRALYTHGRGNQRLVPPDALLVGAGAGGAWFGAVERGAELAHQVHLELQNGSLHGRALIHADLDLLLRDRSSQGRLVELYERREFLDGEPLGENRNE